MACASAWKRPRSRGLDVSAPDDGLDRDQPPELQIARLVDSPHSTPANLGEGFVIRK